MRALLYHHGCKPNGRGSSRAIHLRRCPHGLRTGAAGQSVQVHRDKGILTPLPALTLCPGSYPPGLPLYGVNPCQKSAILNSRAARNISRRSMSTTSAKPWTSSFLRNMSAIPTGRVLPFSACNTRERTSKKICRT